MSILNRLAIALNRLAIALMTFLVPMAFAGTANAQAGLACSGTTCGLGGQLRGQIGDGLPLPISFQAAGGGEIITTKMGITTTITFMGDPITFAGVDLPPQFVTTMVTVLETPTKGPFVGKTILAQPFTPGGAQFVGKGLGQQGQIKPTTTGGIGRTIMQTTASPHTDLNPRALTLAPGVFQYHPTGTRRLGLLAFNSEVLDVQTSLIFDSPHPGTTEFGAPVPDRKFTAAGVTTLTLPGVPGGGGSAMLFAGGRPGLSKITFCALGLFNGGTPGNNFGSQCLVPADGVTVNGAGINGIVTFTKTKNQFGGIWTGRTLGTAQVFFNVNNLVLAQLPCLVGNEACAFGISVVDVQSTGLGGGPFGSTANNASFMATPGIFTGSLGLNGTVLFIGNPVTGTVAGVPSQNLPFTGQPATSVGFPLTTGMITVSVTDALPTKEVFIRTGTDARDANGNGVVALNSGTMSARPISRGNANRGWTTLEIPEPSAIFAASAGLFALFGCHQLVRRRSR